MHSTLKGFDLGLWVVRFSLTSWIIQVHQCVQSDTWTEWSVRPSPVEVVSICYHSQEILQDWFSQNRFLWWIQFRSCTVIGLSNFQADLTGIDVGNRIKSRRRPSYHSPRGDQLCCWSMALISATTNLEELGHHSHLDYCCADCPLENEVHP